MRLYPESVVWKAGSHAAETCEPRQAGRSNGKQGPPGAVGLPGWSYTQGHAHGPSSTGGARSLTKTLL